MTLDELVEKGKKLYRKVHKPLKLGLAGLTLATNIYATDTLQVDVNQPNGKEAQAQTQLEVNGENYTGTTNEKGIATITGNFTNQTPIQEEPRNQPNKFKLEPAYPNPGNDTQIDFHLQKQGKTTINIYNIKGQKLKTWQKNYTPGEHSTKINMNTPNGIYLIQTIGPSGKMQTTKYTHIGGNESGNIHIQPTTPNKNNNQNTQTRPTLAKITNQNGTLTIKPENKTLKDTTYTKQLQEGLNTTKITLNKIPENIQINKIEGETFNQNWKYEITTTTPDTNQIITKLNGQAIDTTTINPGISTKTIQTYITNPDQQEIKATMQNQQGETLEEKIQTITPEKWKKTIKLTNLVYNGDLGLEYGDGIQGLKIMADLGQDTIKTTTNQTGEGTIILPTNIEKDSIEIQPTGELENRMLALKYPINQIQPNEEEKTYTKQIILDPNANHWKEDSAKCRNLPEYLALITRAYAYEDKQIAQWRTKDNKLRTEIPFYEANPEVGDFDYGAFLKKMFRWNNDWLDSLAGPNTKANFQFKPTKDSSKTAQKGITFKFEIDARTHLDYYEGDRDIKNTTTYLPPVSWNGEYKGYYKNNPAHTVQHEGGRNVGHVWYSQNKQDNIYKHAFYHVREWEKTARFITTHLKDQRYLNKIKNQDTIDVYQNSELE